MSTEDLRKALKKEHKLWEYKELAEEEIECSIFVPPHEHRELKFYQDKLKKLNKKIIRLLKKELDERGHADNSNLNATEGVIVRDGALYLRYVAPKDGDKCSGLSWVANLRDATFFPGVLPFNLRDFVKNVDAEILYAHQECRLVLGKTTP